MRTKDFNIGDTAKIMGISPALLRHYESKGIIDPMRGENDYRFYDVDMIKKLSGIRRFRSMGFSLKDAEVLVKAPEQEVALQLHQERLTELEKELEWKQHMLKVMDFLYTELEAAVENTEKCAIVQKPAMLWMKNRMTEQLGHKDSLQLRAWLDCMPVVLISPRFSLADIMKKAETQQFGYVVEQEHARRLGLAHTPGAIKIEASRYVSTVVYSEDAEHIKTSQLSFMIDKAEEMGFVPAGDAWGITLGNFCIDQNVRKYHRVYLPIKK